MPNIREQARSYEPMAVLVIKTAAGSLGQGASLLANQPKAHSLLRQNAW
ncbi:hypothetical protein PSEUDO9AG_60162 [Pseudomonas sp. 9Ag]|nr:hypothetical protein PSEUDO9AG_60162 [Pseudomonas sp. 9Ag]